MDRIIDKKRSVFCLIVVSAAYFWTNFHRLSMAVLAPYLMEDMGITTAQTGTLGSIMFLMYGLTQIPFGIIADKFGSKKLVISCIILTAIGTYIFGHADNYTQLLIGRLITGLAVSGIYVPSLSMMRGWFDIREYSSYLGIFLAIGNIGAVLATTPFEILLSNFGIVNVYNVFALITLLISIASFFLYEKPINIKKSRKADKDNQSPKEFYVFLAAVCLFGLLYTGARQSFQSLWGATYYISVFNYSVRTSSLLLMVFSIAGIFVTPIIGVLASKIGSYKTLVLMALATATVWILLGLTPANSPIYITGLMAFLIGAVNNSTMQNAFTVLGNYASPNQRSLTSAIFNTANFFGGAAYTQILGIVFEGVEMSHGTFLIVFVIYAALIALGILVVSFAKKRLNKNLKFAN